MVTSRKIPDELDAGGTEVGVNEADDKGRSSGGEDGLALFHDPSPPVGVCI